MVDRFLIENNNNLLSENEKMPQIDPNSEEFQEIQFHFNTIFNDVSRGSGSSEQKSYGIESAFPLRNQYISLNFEKREMNEITSYGWYNSKLNDEKKYEESMYKLRLKGLDKIDFDINVSPQTNEDINDIIICKFIIGECYISFQDKEVEEEIEELAEKYDTIVKIVEGKSKKYRVLKPENVELLYLVKLKTSSFDLKTIQCSFSNNCKLNEQGGDSATAQEKKIYYCLLCDNYLCYRDHLAYHQDQILFGEFGVENCEKKDILTNYQGECENKSVHQKNEVIEFFCRECNKGICSYCRFYSSEKHKDLCMISKLFLSSSLNDKNATYKGIKDEYIPQTRELYSIIEKIQDSNRETANKLRDLITKAFSKMFKETNDSFTNEGEKLLGMCYQLNYLKDCINNFDKLYSDKEKLLSLTKLKQELYWTKKTHYDNILHLINLKETINSNCKFEQNKIDKIIEKYKKICKEPLSLYKMMDDLGNKEIGQEKKNMKLTVKILREEAGINNKIAKKGKK